MKSVKDKARKHVIFFNSNGRYFKGQIRQGQVVFQARKGFSIKFAAAQHHCCLNSIFSDEQLSSVFKEQFTSLNALFFRAD
jgi:hypothetical protein